MPSEDEMDTVPKIEKKVNLFGKELIAICDNGNLPSPILVGLTWFFSGSPKDKILLLKYQTLSILLQCGVPVLSQIIDFTIGT